MPKGQLACQMQQRCTDTLMYPNKVACTPLFSHKAHRDICTNNSKLGEELFTIKGKSTCILNLQKDLLKARSFLVISHRSFRGSQESQQSATALAEGKFLSTEWPSPY